MSPVTPVLWFFFLWSLGWLVLPVTLRWWGRGPGALADVGIAAGRPLLLAAWSLCYLWLGHVGLPVRWGWLCLAFIAAYPVYLWITQHAQIIPALRAHRRGIACSDGLLLLVFLFFFLMRGFWPDINNGEKPMDMALLSACTRAEYMPPPNPYAAGRRLESYYYLGHLGGALMTRTLGQEPRWTYNLLCATLPALCSSVLLSLVATLTARLRRGLAVVALLLLVGTLEPLRQWFFPPVGMERSPLPLEWLLLPHLRESVAWMTSRGGLDYFSTSRVMLNTINEYPWFTFHYADLHAHYFAMPLALCALCVAWALFNGRVLSRRARLALGGAAAIVAGAFLPTNTWDFPTYSLLLMGSATALLSAAPELSTLPEKVRRGRRQEPPVEPPPTGWRRSRWLAIGLVPAIGILVALPWLRHLQTAADPPRLLGQPASPPLEWLLLWGWPLLVWLGSLLTFDDPARAGRRQLALRLSAGGLLLWLVLRLATGQSYVILLLLLATFIFTVAAYRTAGDPRLRWLCLLASCGLLALLWSEVTFAGFLGDGPNKRQDTVFKFGLQCWYLWGVAVCGLALGPASTMPGGAPLYRRWRLPLRVLCAGCILIGLTASASVMSARARDFGPGTFGSWDAWAHLAPAEQEAAQWLYEQARDGDNLIEAEFQEGGDYTEFTRYAHATGVPAVVGPQAHTFQWGVPWDEVFGRKKQVRDFYNLPVKDPALPAEYGVRFVMSGELERREYGAQNVNRLQNRLPQLFAAGSPADPLHQVAICGMNK